MFEICLDLLSNFFLRLLLKCIGCKLNFCKNYLEFECFKI